MINIVRYGSTAENNSWILPEGMLSQDVEKNAVRVHDGVTPGGFEAIGVRAFTPPDTGPGSQFLVAGDMTAGYFGEVSSGELLTYEDLATQIGISEGVSQFNAESLWLKFALEDRILFIAKKPIRHSISWTTLDTAGCVFGETEIAVNDRMMKVRLLKGVNSDPTSNDTGYNIETTHESEWNRLLYPVHNGHHSNQNNPVPHDDPTAEPYGTWDQFTENELAVNRTNNNGTYTFCQETVSTVANRLARGGYGVTHNWSTPVTTIASGYGWRPVLELIPN